MISSKFENDDRRAAKDKNVNVPLKGVVENRTDKNCGNNSSGFGESN